MSCPDLAPRRSDPRISPRQSNPWSVARRDMKSNTGACAIAGLRRLPLLTGSVVVLLLAGTFCVVVGTILGLQHFRDVGYPDSATLLRVRQYVHSGHLY